MIASEQDVTETIATQDRLIGQIVGERNGATTVLIGGMHGNEPAGVKAIQRVFYLLNERNIKIRGTIYGLIGNVAALEIGERFINKDFNRMWESSTLQSVEDDPTATAETNELHALLEVFEKIKNKHDGSFYFLDLHTTSSNSSPFAVFGDTLRNRKFALDLNVPIVLGLEEAIKGTMIEYLTDLGYVSLAYEAGQHDSPDSARRHEAAIWLALASSGQIDKKDIPDFTQQTTGLAQSFAGIPPIMEVTHRHAISPDDKFEMKPGFQNFQPVRKGQVLATFNGEDIAAHHDGVILMPLYQGLGDDGFFIARPVRAYWLEISKLLRKIRLDKLVSWLPGVSKHPVMANVYIVKQKIARWYAREFLHLLGFRCEKVQAGKLLVSKRKYDFSPAGR